jgi:hypothetical protein
MILLNLPESPIFNSLDLEQIDGQQGSSGGVALPIHAQGK